MRTFGRAKVFTLSQRIPFSQMLNLSSDLLLVLDQNLIINQVNEPFTKLFGLSRETLIGIPLNRSPFAPYYIRKKYVADKGSSHGELNIFILIILRSMVRNIFLRSN